MTDPPSASGTETAHDAAQPGADPSDDEVVAARRRHERDDGHDLHQRVERIATGLTDLAARVGVTGEHLAYANPTDFSDVTTGNNGAFSAGPGWDPTTGLGSPIGGKLLTQLEGSVVGATPGFPPSRAASSDPSSLDVERDLWNAMNSLKVAVDGMWHAVHSWAEDRGLK